MVTIGIISIFFCVSVQSHIYPPQPGLCFAWETDVYMWIWAGTKNKGSSQADLGRAECVGGQVTRSKAGEWVYIPGNMSMPRPERSLRNHSFLKAFPPVMLQNTQPGYKKKHEEYIEEQGQNTMKDKEPRSSTMVQETAIRDSSKRI